MFLQPLRPDSRNTVVFGLGLRICIGFLLRFPLGFPDKCGNLENIHKFGGLVGIIHSDAEFLRVGPEDVGTADFFCVGVYHVIHISVGSVFYFVDHVVGLAHT